MKKYLKHIIVVILFCLLSIIIFKYFVMKEGNELKDKIAELRTDASELEKNLMNIKIFQIVLHLKRMLF